MDKAETRRSRAKIEDVREQRATATPFKLLKEKNGELRKAGPGPNEGDYVLEGYASTWEPYDCYGGVVEGGWVEQLDRRAFDATLRTNPDLQLLINHEGMPLARTKSGTLELSTDRAGLKVRAYLDPRDPDVQALLPKMQRGDMDEMSFAFRVKGQEWNDNYTHRNITEVSLQKGDVSVVNYGMNPTTKASIMLPTAIEALAHMGDEEFAELRKLPGDELDSAMRAILRARGIWPAEDMAWDELDRKNAVQQALDARGKVLSTNPPEGVEDERAKPSDPKDPDKDPETGVDPDDEKDPKRDGMDDDEEENAADEDDKEKYSEDDEDEEEKENDPVAIATPYVADVPYDRDIGTDMLPEGQAVQGPKKKHPKHPKTPGRVEGYVGMHTPPSQDPDNDGDVDTPGQPDVDEAASRVIMDANASGPNGMGDADDAENVTKVPEDSQDNTTPGNASATEADDMLVKDTYCTLCGETDHEEGACKGVDLPVGEGFPEQNSARTIGDQDPKDPKKKKDGSDDSGDDDNDQAQDPDDDEDDKKSRSIAAEILAGSKDDSLYDEVAQRLRKQDDEDDPRKRNYTLTRALAELDEDAGPGLSLRDAASEFLAEDRDYSEKKPEPQKQPEPEPEPEERAKEPEPPKPPPLSISDAFKELREGVPSLRLGGAERLVSQEIRTPEAVDKLLNPPPPPEPKPEPEKPPAMAMDDAWRELREGDDVLDVERAEKAAVPADIETPEVVERLMQPPPEPEPEPEREPVDVRSELQKFLEEDRQRYSLEDALKRAAELGAKEIARDNPTTHGIDAGWDVIDNATKRFLHNDEGAA